MAGGPSRQSQLWSGSTPGAAHRPVRVRDSQGWNRSRPGVLGTAGTKSLARQELKWDQDAVRSSFSSPQLRASEKASRAVTASRPFVYFVNSKSCLLLVSSSSCLGLTVTSCSRHPLK